MLSKSCTCINNWIAMFCLKLSARSKQKFSEFSFSLHPLCVLRLVSVSVHSLSFHNNNNNSRTFYSQTGFNDFDLTIMKYKALFRFMCGFVFGLVMAKLFLLQDCVSILTFTKSFINSNQNLAANTTVGSDLFKNNLSSIKRQQSGDESSEEEVECKVPKLDPWHASIRQFIEHPKRLHCDQIQPYMTYIDMHGYFTINKTESDRFKRENVSFHCKYRTLDRKYGYNDDMWYSNISYLQAPILLDKDAVEVICEYDDDTLFYYNVHAHPAYRKDLAFPEPTDDQLSVLVFVVDSVSHSALQRNLPLTYDYVKNVMGMKFFNAFNKIGTNSFPNQMAWYTGKLMYSEEDMSSETLGGPWYKERKYDSWPIIWKVFGAKSYATVFNEDWPTYGLFHYMAKGFTKKMFDYYYHWFWLRVEQVNSNMSSSYCFYNEPLPKIHIDIARRHVISLKDTLQFIVTVLTETTHSFDNTVELIDEYLLQFWKDVYEGDYLQNTFVIFASDHGLRMGDIRATYVGAMEDRLPFYGLWFPKWFYEQYPHIEKNIDGNLNMLSSMFDVHETLIDVAASNFNGKQRKRGSRGQSQLYPIRPDRTCSDAGVADRWCTCHKQVEVDPNTSEDAKEAAIYLVDYMNWSLLYAHKDKCQNITFTKYNFFQKVDLDEEENEFNKTHFFLSLETEPHNATFEVFLTMKLFDGGRRREFRTKKGLIDRTSRYDIYSYCMDNWWLKHFCSCK